MKLFSYFFLNFFIFSLEETEHETFFLKHFLQYHTWIVWTFFKMIPFDILNNGVLDNLLDHESNDTLGRYDLPIVHEAVVNEFNLVFYHLLKERLYKYAI